MEFKIAIPVPKTSQSLLYMWRVNFSCFNGEIYKSTSVFQSTSHKKVILDANIAENTDRALEYIDSVQSIDSTVMIKILETLGFCKLNFRIWTYSSAILIFMSFYAFGDSDS